MKIKIGVVLVITAVFLAVVLWDLDLDAAGLALRQARWEMFGPMFALYLVAHCLRAWRLQLLVGHGVRYKRAFAINTIGFLAINVIPLRLGEMVRPYLFWEREGVPMGRALAAILLERLLDLAMLLLMLLGLTWVVELPAEGIVVQGIDVVAAGQKGAGLVVGVGVFAGVVVVVAGEPVIRLIERLPLGDRIGVFARRFREAFQELAQRPLRAVLLVGISLTIWAVTITAVGVVMSAFDGIPATVSSAWATWSITLAGMAAIPTPGFFGAYELFCSAALWVWGVDADVARTFALVLHLGQLGFIVGIGSIFLALEGLSLRDLVQPPTPPLQEPAE